MKDLFLFVEANIIVSLKILNIIIMTDIYSRVLVFGGTGSLGSNLVNKWTKEGFVGKFYIYSRDEYKQWLLRQKHSNANFILGDINDYDKVEKTILETLPTLIIIASAMKHIDRCQNNVAECFNTNVNGVLNVLKSVEKLNTLNLSNNLKKILYVSTDKACEPITVYGMSKGMSEHIIQTREWSVPNVDLVAVRYGNVVNSNGSIIPIFQNQSKNGDYMLITDLEMTRFYMTLDQSVDLIKDAIDFGESREIWIPKLRSMKIIDLANIFCKKYNKNIKIIGLRCREKIHECLISEEEFKYTKTKQGKDEERYVITNDLQKNIFKQKYESCNNLISIKELENLLENYI